MATLTIDPEPGRYYVSIRRDGRTGLLLGPFTRHADALAQVKEVMHIAGQIDPWSDFDSFGTLRMKDDYTKPGRLNAHPAFAEITIQ